MKYKSKTLQEQGKESNKILYILCQADWRTRKKERKRSIKKYQGGLERERRLWRFVVLLSSAYKPTKQDGTKHDQLFITHSDM